MKIRMPDQFETGSVFGPSEIREVITPEYAKFLKEAGYVDLERTPNLFVASSILRVDDRVREVAQKQEVDFYDNKGYVTRIQQNPARKLIHTLGGKVLTPAFMYRLVIPSLKLEAKKGNLHAKATLAQMENEYAEYLEDIVLDERILVIGRAKRELSFPATDGYFDRKNMNEFGYPKAVKQSGEFYYRYSEEDESIAIRGGDGSRPSLSLYWEPGLVSDGLGVRFAKFS